jgi:diguanylate cyclase (GGDEF)-like protein
MVASRENTRIDLFVVADAVLISLACALVFFAYKEISAAPGRQARDLANIAVTIAQREMVHVPARPGDGNDPAARRSQMQQQFRDARESAETAVTGARLRFYSEHPDFKSAGEPADPRMAAELGRIQAAGAPIAGESLTIDGKGFQRASAPVQAQENCRDCADRGVQPYRQGDIVGVMEAIVPVGDDFVRTIRQLLYAAAVLATALMCVLGIIFPVIKRHREEKVRMKYVTESLEREALTDSLTGLANRRFFETALDNYLKEFAAIGVPVSLLLFDIDRFKAINDTHGHDAGDRVLKEVGARLRQSARDYDIVARIGGDEFAVITPYLDDHNLEAVAERYRSNVGRMRLAAPGGVIAATVSVGAAIGIGQDANKGDLFRAADEKLYEAKRAGRDRVAA